MDFRNSHVSTSPVLKLNEPLPKRHNYLGHIHPFIHSSSLHYALTNVLLLSFTHCTTFIRQMKGCSFVRKSMPSHLSSRRAASNSDPTRKYVTINCIDTVTEYSMHYRATVAAAVAQQWTDCELTNYNRSNADDGDNPPIVELIRAKRHVTVLLDAMQSLYSIRSCVAAVFFFFFFCSCGTRFHSLSGKYCCCCCSVFVTAMI